MKILCRIVCGLMVVWASTSLAIAETAIETSFENPSYNIGSIKNQNKWTLKSGAADVTSAADHVKSGQQGVRLYADNTLLTAEYVAYANGSSIALEGDVYVDMWIKMNTIPTSPIALTCCDLGPSTHRTAMVEFTTGRKIKAYNGSSGYATQPSYCEKVWTRISLKIDHRALKYEIAINGQVINASLNFREIRNNATMINWHSLRLTMDDSGVCDISLDDLYIGNDPIKDVPFGDPVDYKKLTITNPLGGTITTKPAGELHPAGTTIEATLNLNDGYEFVTWSGDVTASDNPTIFTISDNMAISAQTRAITNPKTITITAPTHGVISLSPNSYIHSQGSTVTATANIPDPYEFVCWTGDITGTDNPLSFVIEQDMAFSATVRLKPSGVPAMCRSVKSVAEFKNALTLVNPGDTILVADGNYAMGSITLSRPGVVELPILIAAENLHKAKITGKSYFNIRKMSSIIIRGFDIDVEPVSTIFKLEGSDHIRITQNKLRMQKSSDTQASKWIIIGDVWDSETCTSHHNRIDHNLFQDKFDSGAWVVLDGSHGAVPAISTYDRIDHNIFRNNTPRAVNEKETIRLGVSDLSMRNSYCTVEYNLFEDCDGDPEFVSVKSCYNVVRYNTFRRCLGTLSLRHGNNNRAEGNYFFGENKTAQFEGGTIGCGGIRVYGFNQTIVNNYMQGLTGSRWDAAITLTNGDVLNNSTSLSSHFIPENVLVAHNTMIDNASNIEIGFDNGGKYGKYPKNCKISNNIIVDKSNPIVKSYSANALLGVGFENNIFYPTQSSSIGLSNYSDSQIKEVDPCLVISNCRAISLNCDYQTREPLYKLSPESWAINRGSEPTVTVDMEGQPKDGIRDIGADEWNGTDPIISFVLDENSAGPTAPEKFSFEYIGTHVDRVLENNQGLVASHSPFEGSVLISYYSDQNQEALWRFYNAEGGLLYQEHLFLQAGNNTFSLQTSHKGVVIGVLRVGAKNESITLISH